LHAAFRSCELPDPGAIMCFCAFFSLLPAFRSDFERGILISVVSKERAPGTPEEENCCGVVDSFPPNLNTLNTSCGLAGLFSISCTSLPKHSLQRRLSSPFLSILS